MALLRSAAAGAVSEAVVTGAAACAKGCGAAAIATGAAVVIARETLILRSPSSNFNFT